MDRGSFDPDGDPFQAESVASRAYPLGTNLVALTVTG